MIHKHDTAEAVSPQGPDKEFYLTIFKHEIWMTGPDSQKAGTELPGRVDFQLYGDFSRPNQYHVCNYLVAIL